MNRVLLVEDERDLSRIVCDTLSQQGYDVTAAFDGIEGLTKYRAEGADLVVADVMMPRLDGFAMAREIRRISSGVPIIFLTAKSSIDDVEEGFGIGANDYLKKPFELRELIVRIKALLREKNTGIRHGSSIKIGKFTFEMATQLLTSGGDQTLLTYFEAKVLEQLAANIGRTVDASALMMAVWQRDDIYNRNSLHGFIHKLRRYLASDPSVAIINQRGIGYMLTVKT